MVKKIYAAGIILGLITAVGYSQTMNPHGSLFSDIKSTQVGKGITVLVMEYAQASSDAKSETKKKSDHQVTVSAGDGLFSFMPDINLGGDLQNDFRGDAKTSKRGMLKAKIAARIIGQNEAGDYIIEGKRVIEINNEKETYVLSGCVRPEDIQADNTVYSYNIYDAHIIYRGKGEVSRAQKAGLLTRMLQWIF
ncbi:MAG: flagellar basal body L-ring protein FlgH [Calditrichia bacterium]